jgi:hypothetical protein
MTALEMIKASLRLIGVVSADETIDATTAANAKQVWNMMLGLWGNEGLMIYTRTDTAYNLQIGVGSYTIGSGATFSGVRPIAIDSAFVRDGTDDLPLALIGPDEYFAIAMKASASTYPTHLYYNAAYPQGTIYVYPVPSAVNALHLIYRKAFTEVSELSDALALPPGYEMALRYNLAVELAPEFGVAIPALVLDRAAKSKAVLKTTNAVDVLMQCEDMIGERRAFNIYEGA